MKEKIKKSRVKYVGIKADARELGVTRQHLWEVLEGNRVSKRLSERYKQLKSKQAKETNNQPSNNEN